MPNDAHQVYHRVYHRTRGRSGNWDVQRQEIDGLWFNIGAVVEIRPREWRASTGGRVVSVTGTKRAAVRELIKWYETEKAAVRELTQRAVNAELCNAPIGWTRG